MNRNSPLPALVVLPALLLACGWQRSFAQSQPPGSRNESLKLELQRPLDRGLNWLRTNQNAKGYWSTPEHPAVTALALTALQGARNDPAGETSDPVIRRGYEFLQSCAQPDGSIHTGKGYANYNTSVSVMALVATHRAEFKPILLKARRYLIRTQTDLGEAGKIDHPLDGGIGYGSSYDHSDMGNMIFALEALHYTKQIARDENPVDSPDLNWQAAIHFLQNCQNLTSYNKQPWASDDPRNKGGFVYYPGNSKAGETNLANGRVALRSYGSISYGGMLSYAYADLKKDDPRVQAVLDWLRGNFTLDENPGLDLQGLYFYYHTMTKALNSYDIDFLETTDGKRINWREAVALKLMNLQREDGSWANSQARWWESDRALVTSYSVIALKMIQNKL